MTNDIDPAAPPSGEGCAECLERGGWWFHLRRCAACGHVGCCDSSPAQHATAHFEATGHAVVQSFEPGEDWCWNYKLAAEVEAVTLAPPRSHPKSQPTPGPAGAVPADWQDQLN